jgi:multidrug efflux pump subunit AcrA (membrane-fusion protein)
MRRPSPRAAWSAGLVLVGGLGWWLVGGKEAGEDAAWTEVRRDDLVIGLEVTGTLEAVDSSQLGPPQIPDFWEYKISMLANEGAEVKPGDPVLAFDATALERKLEEKLSESASASKKIEKKEAEAALRAGQDRLELIEAESKARKARLIVDRPPEVAAARELEKARLDLAEAEKQAEFVRARMESSRRADDVILGSLRSQRDAAERRVREIRDAIEQMTVKAPRRGTVVTVENWRAEKKKVGDSVWRGEKILEIPDLARIRAKGEVDEADAGRLAAGQRVKLHLDAHPDVEFTGKVVSIWSTVQQRSWQDPVKIVRIDIDLDRTDTMRMRPGMRFQGTIETDRIANALVVPVEAVFPKSRGPVAYRRGHLGWTVAPLELGRRNDKVVEVLRGLEAGDEVARTDLSLREKSEG